MNRIIAISTLAASLLTSFVVHAADTTELKVQGAIKPAACLPTFSGGGVVDYGVIPASSLPAGQYKKLETRQISMNISCNSVTKIAIRLTDNRASSRIAGIVSDVRSDAYNYGLGTVNGKNVGGYSLKLGPTTMDRSETIHNFYSWDNGRTWQPGAFYLQHVDHIFSFGNYVRDYGLQALGFTVLNTTIDVATTLNKPENLPLAQDVPLDGSATLEMIYL